MRMPRAFAACACACACMLPASLDATAIGEVQRPYRYVNSEHGFSLEIPAGWTAASGVELQRLLRPLASAGTPAPRQFVLVVQQGDTSSLHYPSVLVAVFEYGSTGPPSEDAMPALAEQLRGIHARRQSPPPAVDVPELVEKRRLECIQVFPEKRAYTFAMVTEIEGVGTIRARSYGHFGGRCIVQLVCGTFEADFEQYWPTFKEIDESFAFEPGHEYKGPNRGFGVTLYNLVRVFFTAACVVVVINWYAKRRRARRWRERTGL